MFQPRSATARHAIDSIDKVNNKVDDESFDNFIGTSGVYTSSPSKSSYLSKFSDDFAREKWIDSTGRQEETSSFDLSPRISQNPRNRESDENQISEKDRTEPEVSKTSFTRSVHQRKILRMLREGGGGPTDQGWENSFRPRQEGRLASEKWTPSDNTEEDALLPSSYVSSHDFLAERLGRQERSIDNDVSDDGGGQANTAAIAYNHLPLHLARNDQSDEKCSGCVNSLNSEGRERSAKPFRSANSDHRGSSWTGDAITENEDAGDSRDKEDDYLLVTENPTAERKRLKVIQSARKLQNSIKTFQLDKDLFTVF